MNTKLNWLFKKWIDLSLAARLRGVKDITAMTNVTTFVRNLQSSAVSLISVLIYINTFFYWFKEKGVWVDNLVRNIRCDILRTGKRLYYDEYHPTLQLYFPDKYDEKIWRNL